MADVDTHGHEHHHDHDHDHPMSVEEAVRSLLLLGQVAMDKGDHESAVEAYRSALALEQNETALYNLASLYARGLGVKKNYLEAARLFHEAELMGNERAGALCRKCMFDFVHVGIELKKPADLYAAVAVFVSRVYPEAEDKSQEVKNGLAAIAATCESKGETEAAAKALKAIDEVLV